jgi:hypothetical protein
VQFAAPGSLTNSGTIVGGTGGPSYPAYPLPRVQIPRGPGGIGADLTAGGTLMNTGTIIGGTGGGGIIPGTGGTGVALASGGTSTNTGTITGGAGGVRSTDGSRGAGGIGVFLNGGTLTNSGTVAGGTGSSTGAAVQLGTTAATLIVNPGAVFNGQVIANAAVADVLELSGTAAGTLTSLGTNFTNFSSITVDQSAHWSLSGANTLAAGTTLTNSGSLSFTGTGISGAGSFVNNGTVAMTSAGTVDVGTAFINSALVSVGSGTMEFLAPVDGNGTVAIQSGATADFEQRVAPSQNASFQLAGGTLDLGNPSTFLGTIVGFAKMDTIDLVNTPYTGATKLSYAGGTLTVTNGSTTVASLSFQGSYVTKDFAINPDGHGGSVITHS